MRQRSTNAAVVVVVLLWLWGCEKAPSGERAKKPLVVASFYPLWEFSRHVAGDLAEVVALVPPGVEPHDWEPSPSDVARLERARVFVMNGVGFETWAERLLANVKSRTLVVVTATEGIDLIPVDLPPAPLTDAHGHADRAPVRRGRATPGRPGQRDPHVWMDPVLAQAQVERIRAGLAGSDPPRAATYEHNASAYARRLAELHGEFERGLAACDRRDMVVSHAAFAYLARRYGLTHVPVMGLAPEVEPSPADLARVVRFARRHRVTHIFFETLVSPTLAETLARELGATGLALNPLEGLTKTEIAAGADYVSIMRGNLANLRTGLRCR